MKQLAMNGTWTQSAAPALPGQPAPEWLAGELFQRIDNDQHIASLFAAPCTSTGIGVHRATQRAGLKQLQRAHVCQVAPPEGQDALALGHAHKAVHNACTQRLYVTRHMPAC